MDMASLSKLMDITVSVVQVIQLWVRSLVLVEPRPGVQPTSSRCTRRPECPKVIEDT